MLFIPTHIPLNLLFPDKPIVFTASFYDFVWRLSFSVAVCLIYAWVGIELLESKPPTTAVLLYKSGRKNISASWPFKYNKSEATPAGLSEAPCSIEHQLSTAVNFSLINLLFSSFPSLSYSPRGEECERLYEGGWTGWFLHSLLLWSL